MTIADQAVLVTGANRGIGQALVAEALRRGAQRVYAGTRQPLDHPDERVTPLALDVTDRAQIRAAAGQIESLDLLINNAGLALYDDLTDRAALERSLAVNFFGMYDVTQAVLPPSPTAGAAAWPRRWNARTRRSCRQPRRAIPWRAWRRLRVRGRGRARR